VFRKYAPVHWLGSRFRCGRPVGTVDRVDDLGRPLYYPPPADGAVVTHVERAFVVREEEVHDREDDDNEDDDAEDDDDDDDDDEDDDDKEADDKGNDDGDGSGAEIISGGNGADGDEHRRGDTAGKPEKKHLAGTAANHNKPNTSSSSRGTTGGNNNPNANTSVGGQQQPQPRGNTNTNTTNNNNHHHHQQPQHHHNSAKERRIKRTVETRRVPKGTGPTVGTDLQ
jgi:hypothetical protein